MRTTPRILDQISAEKTKVSERLARLDADRATVTAQLTDLEAAERVRGVGSQLRLPHPIFVRSCVRGDRLARHPNQLAELIETAPTAFSDERTFLAEGAVVIQLLEIGEAAVRQTAFDEHGSIRVAPLDKSELLTPTIERCHAATKTLLDALFVRPDAIPLAWAWLEQLVSSGKLRGRLPVGDGTRVLAVNLPMLLIAALAERLFWRSDWEEWIGKRKGLWRIYRATAVFAVGTFGKGFDSRRLAKALERALTNGDLEYGGIPEAITDTQDIVGAVGGRAVSLLDDPGCWFEATWEKLRPNRERSWRVGDGGGKHNSTGELLALWGLAAQTDTFGYAPVWTKALVRLFSYFPPNENEGRAPVGQQMAQALFPYIAADYGF